MKTKRILSVALAVVLMIGTLAFTSCGTSAPNLPIVCGETGMNDLCGIATYGVDYYNSSIDSSPTRTAAALRSFDDKSIVICGGYDKHIPFAPLADVLCEKLFEKAEKIAVQILTQLEFSKQDYNTENVKNQHFFKEI